MLINAAIAQCGEHLGALAALGETATRTEVTRVRAVHQQITEMFDLPSM